MQAAARPIHRLPAFCVVSHFIVIGEHGGSPYDQQRLGEHARTRRFIEAARELGVDTSPETLKRIVREIAPKKPKKPAPVKGHHFPLGTAKPTSRADAPRHERRGKETSRRRGPFPRPPLRCGITEGSTNNAVLPNAFLL
jgi:hypothetical protein